MKINKLIAGFGLLAAAALTSCGGSASSSENCMIFGEIPGLYADYHTQRDEIEGSVQNSKSSYEKVSAQIDELKEQYRAKIEEAGKKLDGQPIEIAASEDFKVVEPISLSFKEFANNVNAVFTVEGEVETVKDVTIDVTESWIASHDVQYLYLPLMLIGCDEQGAEVTDKRIGCFKGLQVVDGKVVLPAGTKAELQTVAYNQNEYDKYIEVKSVKLALDTSKL